MAAAPEQPPEERPDEGAQTPGTADAAEPAGDQDPEAEREYQEAQEEAAAGEAPAESDGGEDGAPATEAGQSEPEDEPEDPAALADRYLELAKRSQAELENFRKRAARDAAQAGERAKANLIRELLPAIDNLERALGTANPEEDHLAEGVRLVHVELVNTLERNGITPFDPKGEPFDPTYHEALSTRESENGAGVVLDVVEKGYQLGETVLRPARVIVSA